MGSRDCEVTLVYKKGGKMWLRDCPHWVHCAGQALPLRASLLLLPGRCWCYPLLPESTWRARKGLGITYSHQRWSLLSFWAACKSYVALAMEMQTLWLKLFLFLSGWVYILRDHLKQSLIISCRQTDLCTGFMETLDGNFFLQTLFYMLLYKVRFLSCWSSESSAGRMCFWVFLTCMLLYLFACLLKRLLSYLQNKKMKLNFCAVLELCWNSLPPN